MEDRKTTLDRERLSSEYIQGKQDFNRVLKVHRAMKPPLWKTAWFYGPVGLAIVAITISAVKFNPQQTEKTAYETKNTLNEHLSTTPQVKATLLATSSITTEHETMEEPVQKAVITSVQRRTEKSESEKTLKKSALKTEVPTKDIESAPARQTAIRVEIDQPAAVKKSSSKNMMPMISGVFMGNITAAQLCNSEGIYINDEWQVTSFTVQYNNGVEEIVDRIKGASIPESVCWKIHRFNLNLPIFITEIVAVDQTGARKSIPSMSLTPVY